MGSIVEKLMSGQDLDLKYKKKETSDLDVNDHIDDHVEETMTEKSDIVTNDQLVEHVDKTKKNDILPSFDKSYLDALDYESDDSEDSDLQHEIALEDNDSDTEQEKELTIITSNPQPSEPK